MSRSLGEGIAAEIIDSVPGWVGAHGVRKTALSHGERLIRLTSGPLAGQLAIVVLSDPSPDPDDDEPLTEAVYTQQDWEAETAPSLGFDGDGDLVWLAPAGYTSSVVSYADVEVAS